MKKKILNACLIGALIGLAISMIITVVISFIIGDGNYHPIVPGLASVFGNELNAVLVQMIFSFAYGAAWAGASYIWKQDRWSLLRQTITHFIICSLTTLPIAYLMHWMPHTAEGMLQYFGIFLGIYVITWISQYTVMKKNVKALNNSIRDIASRNG